MAYSLSTKIVLPVGALIFLIAYGICYWYHRKKRRDTACIRQSRARFVFCFYLLIVMCFTLLPVLLPPIDPQPVEYNWDLRYLLTALSDRAHLIDVAGNALLFAPVVIIGRYAGFRCFSTIPRAALTSCLLSVFIEAAQGLETHFGLVDPASINVVDINDVIMNTAGGIIGWILMEVYEKR